MLQRANDEAARRREEKKQRKSSAKKNFAYHPLKVGRHHFADSEAEDDDPNDAFFVSDEIVKRAGNRKYVRTPQEIVSMRDFLYPLKPVIIDIASVITSPKKMKKILGLAGDDWYLEEGVKPRYDDGWEDLTLRAYFPYENSYRHFLLAAVYSAFSHKDWCGVISHVVRELPASGDGIGIPAKYRRFNVLVGGGSCHRINPGKEIRAFEEDTSSDKFTRGYIYSLHNGTEFTPAEILVPNAIWFEAPLARSMILNDCSTHTFNYALRHPVFTMREQVHRLAMRRTHRSAVAVDKIKKDGG